MIRRVKLEFRRLPPSVIIFNLLLAGTTRVPGSIRNGRLLFRRPVRHNVPRCHVLMRSDLSESSARRVLPTAISIGDAFSMR